MFIKRDEKLVEQALKGNKKAWFTLISRYEGAMYQYGIRMTGNSHDAADLMQEIFISVYRNLASFRGESKFKNWMFKIAHYRCIEHYRKKKPTESLDDVPESPAEDEEACPVMQLNMGQQAKALVSAMQSLPVNQRTVVELKFFQHCTFEEIGQQLGVSTNTVKSRLYTALDKLKGQLEFEYV